MSKFSRIAELMLPPIVTKGARRLKRGTASQAEWEWMPQGFAAQKAQSEIKGWNEAGVLETYRQQFETWKQRLDKGSPLGQLQSGDATEAQIYHDLSVLFGYVLSRVAQHESALSLLDWGGALGQYCLIARALRPDLQLDYSCKEMPLFMEAGRALLPDATFYDDDNCFERNYDLVLAAGAVHYSENWWTDLKKLASASRRGLFVTRLPMTTKSDSYVFVQRAYSYGYNTEYLGWCLNRDEFLAATEELGLVLEREFVLDEKPLIAHAPAPCQYRGFLWLR